MVAFPVAKLGYLAIKQIAKPVANAMKTSAKNSPFFRVWGLQKPAQFYHSMETGVRMRILGLGKSKTVKPLTDEAAVDLGADMLGEIFVFIVGTAIIWAEFRRQANDKQAKEDFQNSRLLELESHLQQLSLQIEEQNTQLSDLHQVVVGSGNGQSSSSKGSGSKLPSSFVSSRSGITLQVENTDKSR